MVEINGITDVMGHIGGLSAVVFDLDDTLYSEKEYVRSGFRAVAKTLPQVEDAENKLWAAFEAGKNAVDEVLGAEGIHTEELKRKCLEAYRSHEPDIHLYEGVEEMLERLRKRHLKTGIITDGRPVGQRAKLKALGLDGRVDRIIVTDELGGAEFRKPCVKAFEMMKEAFGCRYGEMCYVGDNVEKDFVAPEKLGMRAIWFQNRDGLYTPRNGALV